MIEVAPARNLALLGVAAIGSALLGAAMVQGNPAITIAGGQDAHIHMMGAGAGEGASARPTTTVKPLSCEKLPNVPGHSITTALVEFPPNAYTPRHRHPGAVTAFVLNGTLRSRLEGGPAGSSARDRSGSNRRARCTSSRRMRAPPSRPNCWRSSSPKTIAAR
ncbi:cupin domain-containing protein [Mesorhizobium sp. WSM4884]|uniref:cupin domain-containing protein n=1 Tax=Mesorhizobium sp. WSM4884 TaxID=3038542 RepID=UPI002416807F|nr:cupin domain-containing protein [Mesorhizobium sp. WSM4884]MDG4881734.1 cupin domain-containing protein [Mesorhizobium sp. WSM4884]